MNETHSRPKAEARWTYATSVPVSQTQAVDRRHSLDAQQRGYREASGGPRLPGPPRRPA
jgi:hypothetical protein